MRNPSGAAPASAFAAAATIASRFSISLYVGSISQGSADMDRGTLVRAPVGARRGPQHPQPHQPQPHRKRVPDCASSVRGPTLVPVNDLSNAAIADAFEELGDLYELDGAIVHRVLAYRAAARAVREASVSVAALAREGRASELPGIGKTLQEKILALAQSGTIPAAERLRAKFPPGLIEITRLPGLGPKRARLLHTELGIDSLQALREAALAQRLRTVRGLGPKLETTVLEALEDLDAHPDVPTAPRILLPRALEIGEDLLAGLRALAQGEDHVQLAGSVRRQADSIKDIDIIATSKRPTALAKSLAELAEIERVSSAGKAGARARTHSGVGVDLRIAAPGQLG